MTNPNIAASIREDLIANSNAEAARLSALEAHAPRKQTVGAIRAIRPLTNALEVDGSCGLAIKNGRSQKWVIDALTYYLGGSEYVLELDANDTVQGNGGLCSEGVAGILGKLAEFEEEFGGIGVVAVTNLRHMSPTHPDNRGNADIYRYLSGLAHETRSIPARRRDKQRPAVLAIGQVTRTAMSLLNDGELRTPNLGFTMELNDHFVLDDHGIERYFIHDASVALSAACLAMRNGNQNSDSSPVIDSTDGDFAQAGERFLRKRIGL